MAQQQQAAVCTQVHRPTAVTHCTAAWLTHAQPRSGSSSTAGGSSGGSSPSKPLPDLVVVKSTQLELYTVVSAAAGSGGTEAAGDTPLAAGSQAAADPQKQQQQQQQQHLQLVASSQLFGVVESVAVLKGQAPGQRDALLLAFRDAKLSVLCWDPSRHELTPSSLHFFEGDAALKQGRTQFPYPPLAVTDPQGRCAALLMFRHQLAVLPAIDSELLALGIMAEEEGEEDEEAAAAAALGLEPPLSKVGQGGRDGGADGGTAVGAAANGGSGAAKGAGLPAAAAAVGNSYVDNLGKAGIKEVRDACFLHGYNEPVLMLLHEGEPTWAGNLRQKKDTCVLTALSLNLTRKHHPKIWGAQNLPSDAYRVSAVPCGGVLVLCQHLVLHYRQGQQCGVILHPSAVPPPAPPPPLTFDPRAMAEAGGPGPAAAAYARQHAADVHPEAVPAASAFCDASHAQGLKVTADGASVCWLSADTALLCLRSGQLLQLGVLPLAAGGAARRLEVARAGAAPPPSCCCSLAQASQQQQLGPGKDDRRESQAAALVFLGSAAGDSLLVRATAAASSAAVPAGSTKRPASSAAAGGQEESAGEPASKRLRLESTVDELGRTAADGAGDAGAEAASSAGAGTAGGTVSDSEDEEALIYGTALMAPAGGTAPAPAAAAAPVAPSHHMQRYQLKVLDSLTNIGPVRDFAITAATAAAAGGGGGSSSGEAGPPLLVACSGEGKGGMLSLLRRSVVPDVITEVPLPGLLGAWAVRYRSGAAGQEAGQEAGGAEQYHSYLLLSFPGATKVLATGEELREVTDSVEFAVDTPTLAAGSLWGGRRIAQAFPQGIRLLDGEESLQDLWAAELAPASGTADAARSTTGSTISLVAADICDPYCLLLLSDGSAVLLVVDSVSGRLAVNQAATAAAGAGEAPWSRVAACSLYQDSCGWLGARLGLGSGGSATSPDGSGSDAEAGAVYGVLCRASGTTEIFSLPAWQLVFSSSSSLAAGPALLTGGNTGAMETGTLEHAKAEASVVEVRLASFGQVSAGRRDPAALRASKAAACEAPVLLALTSDHQLLAYQAFTFASSSRRRGSSRPGGVASTSSSSSSGLRFRRLRLDVPPLLPPAAGLAPQQQQQQQAQQQQQQQEPRLQRLHCFEGLGEEAPYSGVFVAGQHPQWLIAARGTLLPHPHHLPLPLTPTAGGGSVQPGVAGFTPFHNINCPFGFIVATNGARSGLQISQPPPRTRLDAPWPCQRVAVKGTPLRIAHYAEADLYAVLTARQVPYRPFLPEEEEPGEPVASYSYALADAAAKARGAMQGHELRLVWPGGGWQGVWRHQLLPGERALSVAAVRLKDHSSGATVPLIAVGAALPAGEDYPCGGRLLLFEVVRDGTTSGTTATGTADGTGWSGRLIYTREFRGPVTALAGLEGYLLLASGNRIETCTLSSTTVTSTADDGTVAANTTWKLQRAAFYDGPVLLTSLNVVKNFVLLGDCQHSVQFVRYKDEGRQLTLLSKDFNRADTAATQFLINGSSLHLASCDCAGTLRLLSYAPAHPASWKGQRLVAWGAFHAGEAATAMQRLRLHPPSPEDHTIRQAVLLSTAVGGLSLLAPLAVAQQEAGVDAAAALGALRALQRELVLRVAQPAGLNPAAFRRRHAAIPPGMQGGRSFSPPLPLNEQGVLDGDVLQQYLSLPRQQQHDAAEAAGLVREQVLALLHGLWRAGGTLL